MSSTQAMVSLSPSRLTGRESAGQVAGLCPRQARLQRTATAIPDGSPQGPPRWPPDDVPQLPSARVVAACGESRGSGLAPARSSFVH